MSHAPRSSARATGDVSVLLAEYKWLSTALQHMAPQFGHTPPTVTQLYAGHSDPAARPQ